MGFVNNTDDHLRNHGLIRDGAGWRLAPLFDVNPNPNRAEQRATGVFGETQSGAALGALRAYSDEFGLSAKQADEIIREAGKITRSYAKYANKAGIPTGEQTRFQFIAGG